MIYLQLTGLGPKSVKSRTIYAVQLNSVSPLSEFHFFSGYASGLEDLE